MARPQKKGLEYFPLDVNFYGDIKVRKLMRNNGGGKAAFVYVTLLCKIYESGYYMVWDDDMSFMLSDITGFEEGMIRETVKSCMKFGLFDQDLYNKHNILTSRSIQSRYFSAVKRRVKGRSYPYVYQDLFDELRNMQSETHHETGFMQSEIEFLHTETPFMSTESTLKESKEEDNNSLRSSLSPSLSSSSSSSRVCEGKDKKKSMMPEGVLVSDAVETLSSDRDWLLSMQRRFCIDGKQLVGWLKAFSNDCSCRGTQRHQDMGDVMRHFNDWLAIKLKPASGVKAKGRDKPTVAPAQPVNYRVIWNRAIAELCQLVSAEKSAQTFDKLSFEDYVVGEKNQKNTLTLCIPTMEVYKLLEQTEYVQCLQSVLSKYFGNFKLQYRILGNRYDPAKDNQGTSHPDGQGGSD